MRKQDTNNCLGISLHTAAYQLQQIPHISAQYARFRLRRPDFGQRRFQPCRQHRQPGRDPKGTQPQWLQLRKTTSSKSWGHFIDQTPTYTNHQTRISHSNWDGVLTWANVREGYRCIWAGLFSIDGWGGRGSPFAVCRFHCPLEST